MLDDARLVTITAGGIARRASPRRRPAVEGSTPTGRGSCRSRRSRTRPTEGAGRPDDRPVRRHVESAVETLPSFLAERSMLLVLDNFEHVLDAAAAVAELVRASPDRGRRHEPGPLR
jgi:hypothetical protein